jgi:hypothetical protein
VQSKPPPYGGNVFNSANPEHVKREKRNRRRWQAYEKARAKCPACPAQEQAEADVLRELHIELKPWQLGLQEFPDLVAALEAAAEQGSGTIVPEPSTPEPKPEVPTGAEIMFVMRKGST